MRRSPKSEEAKARREKTREDLKERLQADGDHDLAMMLESCGDPVRLTCTACGRNTVGETRCKKRWCPSCAYTIATERVAKYQAAAERFRWPLFVTLTIRNTPDPEGLKEVKKAWQKFRRRKLIASRVRSGIVGYEVTNKGSGWHPHIHALLDCQWLSLWTPEPTRGDNAEKKAAKCQAAAEELSRAWADLVGQQTASVKARRGDAKALVEVLKYSCKGSELVNSHDPPGPLIRLMLGMRLMSTFGAIRKEIKDEDHEEEEQGGCACEHCGALKSMIPTEIMENALRQAFDKKNHNR